MKYKIEKLADGGGFATFTPIIDSGPSINHSSAQSTQPQQQQEPNSVIDEKMLEYLYKSGGLVNDVNKLVSELIEIERSSMNPYLKSSNRISTLRLTDRVNEISRNKEY